MEPWKSVGHFPARTLHEFRQNVHTDSWWNFMPGTRCLPIPHPETKGSPIIVKLHAYGIRYELFNWIKNYLSNRVQCVYVENEKSSFLPVIYQ